MFFREEFKTLDKEVENRIVRLGKKKRIIVGELDDVNRYFEYMVFKNILAPKVKRDVMWVTRQDVFGMDKKVAEDLVSLGYTVLLTQREREKISSRNIPKTERTTFAISF